MVVHALDDGGIRKKGFGFSLETYHGGGDCNGVRRAAQAGIRLAAGCFALDFLSDFKFSGCYMGEQA